MHVILTNSHMLGPRATLQLPASPTPVYVNLVYVTITAIQETCVNATNVFGYPICLPDA